jgi:hypothetical protein
MVVKPYLGIVNQTQAHASNRKAQLHLPMSHVPRTSQPRINSNFTKQRTTKTAVHTFEKIDISGFSKTEMMVSNDSAKPLHFSNHCRSAVIGWLDIQSTSATDIMARKTLAQLC